LVTLPDQTCALAAQGRGKPRPYRARTKTARALAAADIGTLHVRLLPRQAPDHERNLQPFAGVAVRRTGTNDGKDAEQRGRHVIPVRELRTVPRPPTFTESRKTSGAKSAETVEPGLVSTLQVPAPEHAPLQRTSFAPGRG
jgi:hypothetical protein